MKREELLQQVKRVVHEVEPDAEVILYGSRSRGDALSDSDWDFLILVDGPVNDERTDRIRHQLYEIEWECGVVLSSIVRSREEWNSALYRSLPFHQRIDQEGTRL
jgi:predicted nucleotidyltransferase